jgi:hypothetical protein
MTQRSLADHRPGTKLHEVAHAWQHLVQLLSDRLEAVRLPAATALGMLGAAIARGGFAPTEPPPPRHAPPPGRGRFRSVRGADERGVDLVVPTLLLDWAIPLVCGRPVSAGGKPLGAAARALVMEALLAGVQAMDEADVVAATLRALVCPGPLLRCRVESSGAAHRRLLPVSVPL